MIPIADANDKWGVLAVMAILLILWALAVLVSKEDKNNGS